MRQNKKLMLAVMNFAAAGAKLRDATLRDGGLRNTTVPLMIEDTVGFVMSNIGEVRAHMNRDQAARSQSPSLKIIKP